MHIRKYSAWLALGFGPVVALQSAIRTGGELSGWTVVDALTAFLLISAGFAALRLEGALVSRWLSGAWGFATGALFGSLIDLAPQWNDEQLHDGPTFLVMAGWLLITALVGFAGSMPGPGIKTPGSGPGA